MNLEVLVSTMNLKEPEKFIKKMNINTDAIIVNQCNDNSYKEIDYNEKKIRIYSFSERGVGLSRNTALMRAKNDIAIFADSDVIYVDNYEKIIINEFRNNPKADIILFNLESENNDRPLYNISKRKRINKFNSLKYGAVRVAIRVDKIKKSNIFFSLLFGGGAKYGSGEDTLFINECLKKGLKIYTCPSKIGLVRQQTSTWFQGYNEKYFTDKGALYYCISSKFAFILCLQFIIRHRQVMCKELSIIKAIKYMNKGIKEMKGKKNEKE